MLFTSAVLAFQIVLAYAAPWEGVAREEPSNYGNGAWYQMPQPAQYPTSAYDRAAQSNAAAGYAGYPRPYSRSPDYYPESSVSNNMVPPIGARKSPAIGYGYPNAASAAAAGAMMSTQDRLRLTAIERYLPLLRKKAVTTTPKPAPKPRRRTRPVGPRFASTTPKSPSVDSVMRTLKPKVNTKAKPFIEGWKCAKKPCKRPRPRPRHRSKTTTTTTTTTEVPEVVTKVSKNRDRLPRPRPRGEKRPHRVVRTKAITTTTTEGPDFSSGEEFSLRLRTVRPYTFAPRYKLSRHKTNMTTGSATVASTTVAQTTTTTTLPSTMVSVAFNVSATPKLPSTTTTKTVPTSTSTLLTTVTDPKTPKSLKLKKITPVTTTATAATTPRPKIIIPLPEEPSELVLVPTFKGTQPPRITPSTKEPPVPSLPEFPFNLFAPNAELIAAIKDVVKKFKQSLDRTGVQDDVRQMGSQLETTWNDLRRGKLDQWIERAHQMLADAVTEEEAELLLAAEKARNDAIAATKHKSPAASKPSGQQQYNFVRVSPNKAAVSKAKLQQQPQP